jgi:hypothetical protein
MFYCKEYKLVKVTSHGNDYITCVADDKTEWCLSKIYFYNTYSTHSTIRNFQKWKEVINKSKHVRLWCIKLTQLAGMEVWIDNNWVSAWYIGNK